MELACPPSPLDLGFPNTQSGHIDSGQLLRGGFFPALKAAKLRAARFHDLRHGYASALLATGVDVVRVSRTLDHASPVITMGIYAHVLKGLGAQLGTTVDQIYGTVASGNKVATSASSVAVLTDRKRR